jgi:mycothiol synthase
MAAPTAPIGAPLDALGDALHRDLAAPNPRSAAFRARDSYARVAPAETQHGAVRRWIVGYSPGVGIIGVGTATELLMQSLAHVADHGGGDVTLWREAAVGDDDRAARRAGLEVDRELHQMRARLPLADALEIEVPDDVTVRTFEPGRDDRAWLALNNDAFEGHPEQGGWDAATLRARCREPWFDPSWFLLAESNATMVGFNWLRRHPAVGREPELGEIYVIGVASTARGRGLGRLLAQLGLERITTAGVGTGLLYVATDNAPAISLYRHLGFEISRTDRAYRALIAPADQ